MLPAALAIHGGILMDELGTRRVLMWIAVGSSTLPLLFPITGWFTVLVALQLLLGLASGLGMAASQTWSLQTSKGDTAMLARFGVFSRIGTFIGPVVAGAAWDLYGAWATFACVALCGAGIVASAAYGAPRRESGAPPLPRAMNVLVPRWEPHRQAIALAAIPAVAFILWVSFLRSTPGAIQASLYVVYLNDIGISGTVIGLLVSVTELFGVFGSLLAAPLERVARSDRLLHICVVAAVAAVAVTPLVGQFVILLFVASAVRGIGQGISHPLMYSILGRGAPSSRHGASVGLRNAVVRLSSIITPAAMGVAAEAWGIEASFYVVGAVTVLATAALAIAARRVLAQSASTTD